MFKSFRSTAVNELFNTRSYCYWFDTQIFLMYEAMVHKQTVDCCICHDFGKPLFFPAIDCAPSVTTPTNF
jgi:hypothetical protein